MIWRCVQKGDTIYLCQKDLCICHFLSMETDLLSCFIFYILLLWIEILHKGVICNKNVIKSDKVSYLSTLYFKMVFNLIYSMMFNLCTFSIQTKENMLYCYRNMTLSVWGYDIFAILSISGSVQRFISESHSVTKIPVWKGLSSFQALCSGPCFERSLSWF